MNYKANDLINMLENRQKFEHNYWEDGERYENLEKEYEKKTFNAPFLGCGAGLLLCASAFATGRVPTDVVPVLLPSVWFFLLGVGASYFSGICHIKFLYEAAVSYRTFGNAENLMILMYDELRSGEYISGTPILLEDQNDNFKTQLSTCVMEYALGSATLQKSFKFRTTARLLHILSAIAFLIAVLIPIFALSLQYNFIWQ